MTEITVNSTNNHKHRRHIETSWAHRTGHRSVSTTFLWEIWSLVLKLNSSALGGILSLPHSHISHLCALSQEHWFPVMRTSLNPHSLCWISRHVTDSSSCWLSITHGVHMWRRHKLVHMHKHLRSQLPAASRRKSSGSDFTSLVGQDTVLLFYSLLKRS